MVLSEGIVSPSGVTERAHELLKADADIAERLEEVSRILADQGAQPYRAEAYRRAADTIRTWPQSVAELARTQGVEGLMELPGIGERLAQAIYLLARTGQLPMLDRLRGESDPEELFASVIGIGARTAQRIRDELGIHTLEELEVAAHDGRLGKVGIGQKRLTGIRAALASRLGQVGQRQHLPAQIAPPAVPEILDVDREYRERAASGSLQRIAPRRFNPGHDAWLPVLHTHRGDRQYTALFSNTARAHRLGRTHDWVVLYYDGRGGERQCTVITAERGPLQGRRIIAGREDDCLRYWRTSFIDKN